MTPNSLYLGDSQVVTVDQLLDGPGADLPRWRSLPHKEARAIEQDEQRELRLGG